MGNRLCAGLLAATAGAALAGRIGRRWGATDDEVWQPLPGDALVPHPMVETTHAITIRAPAAQVWPWLAQVGHGRGGWYADGWWERWGDRLLWYGSVPPAERAAYRPTPGAERIIADLQAPQLGDIISDGPPGSAFFSIAELEPGRVLALHSTTHLHYLVPGPLHNHPRLGSYGELSLAVILGAADPGATRLIVRARASFGPRLARALGTPLLLLVDLARASALLRGIKRRAERATTDERPPTTDHRPLGDGDDRAASDGGATHHGDHGDHGGIM